MSPLPTTTLGTYEFQGAKLAVYGTPENPLWIAKEVCAYLGIADHKQTLEAMEEYQKGGVLNTPTSGGPQKMATVTEAGLYALMMRSRKPNAQEFQRWVFTEVLPAIRKQGFYAVTGGLPPGARKLRELELEIEAQRHLLAADESKRKLLILRGGLPPPAPEDVQTVGEWCTSHDLKPDRQELLGYAITVKAFARKHGHPEYRRFVGGNPRYSSPAWKPEVITAALDGTKGIKS